MNKHKTCFLLAIILLFCFLAGCQTPAVETSRFDIEKVRHEVTIDGKKVSVPFRLADLGEGYHVRIDGFSSLYNGIPFGVGALLLHEEQIAIVMLDGNKEDYQKTGKEYIQNIDIYKIYDEADDKPGTILIDGIKVGDSIETVYEKYGEPSAKNILNDERADVHYYKKANTGRYLLFAVENDTIVSIDFSYRKEPFDE